MYGLFSILILITCALLLLVILVQNPKGGGLASTFGEGNQFMGVKKTSDFLEKSTWTLALALVALNISFQTSLSIVVMELINLTLLSKLKTVLRTLFQLKQKLQKLMNKLFLKNYKMPS